MKIRDVMVKEVTTVAAATSLKDVAAILSERGISGLPVVDGGEVVGVVSEADILMKEKTRPTRRGGVLGWLLNPQSGEEAAKLEARTAGEAMTAPAITVDPGRSIAHAAGLMVERGVNRLPVIEAGELVGIVTRADLVRAFTRGDAEIARELREDVILRQFWIPPETVTVEVRNGEVRLTGEVEKKSVAELLASFAERVTGVVAVSSELSWRESDRP